MSALDRFGEVLLRKGLVDEHQLRAAKARQQHQGGRLVTIIDELGFSTEDAMLTELAKTLGLARSPPLDGVLPDAATLACLDAQTALAHAVFPVQLQTRGKVLNLAMADPTDLKLLDDIAHRARVRVVPLLAGEHEIRRAVARLYPKAAATTSAPAKAQPATDFSLELDDAPPPPPGQLPPSEPALTPQQRERVQRLEENREKSAQVRRALEALLKERGLL